MLPKFLDNPQNLRILSEFGGELVNYEELARLLSQQTAAEWTRPISSTPETTATCPWW